MRGKIGLLFTVLFCLAAFATPLKAGQKTLRILHLNDFHGFAEPYKPYGSDEQLGGIAFLAGRLNELRAEKPSLLLAAGDMIQGNNWANLSSGESAVELMNAMGFDAMVTGNHEFDFGLETLRKRIGQARFPFLAANVSGLDGLLPYVIKETGGVMVGIIGVVADDTPLLTHPRNVGGLSFSPHRAAVERCVNELRGKVDVVIVLSHIGHEADRKLAATVNGITAIIGGHSHTKVSSPAVINNTLVLQAWEHAKAIGILDIIVDDNGMTSASARLEDIRPAVMKKAPAVAAIVNRYTEKVDAALNERIGEALVDLDGENVRNRETNLGDFIADIFRSTAAAEIALINGGAIRTGIKKGSVHVRDVFAVLPFDNYIVAIKLTGRQIGNALEHGLAGYEENSGAFPQVSGLRFTFDLKRPAGSRVENITVGDRPIEADREYTVATNDFLAAGGDRYTAFGEAMRSSRDFAVTGGAMKGEKLVFSDPGRWMRDIVVEEIRRLGKIAPETDGRIAEKK